MRICAHAVVLNASWADRVTQCVVSIARCRAWDICVEVAWLHVQPTLDSCAVAKWHQKCLK
jgi:hypothetical protein